MRRVLLVLIWCLPLLASAEEVDFVAKGEPLKIVVERLSEQFNTKLTVSADLADEILVISVTQVGYTELLEKIAEVVHAEWRARPSNALRLERPARTANELKDESLTARANRISKYLDSYEDALATQFDAGFATTMQRQLIDLKARLDQDRMNIGLDQAYDAECAKGPAARLAIRLLKSIDPKLLAGLEYGERRVFNITPTKLQYGFGKGAREAFDKYVAEQNVWAAVAQGLRPSGLMVSNPLSDQRPVLEPPLDWSIELAPGSVANYLFANLVGWDENGNKNVYYQVMPPSPNSMAFVPFRSTEYELPDWLTGLDRELFAAHTAIFGGKRADLSEEASEFIKSPTEGDVGGRMVSSVLTHRYNGRDIVALVADGNTFRMVYMLSVIDDHEQFDDLLDRGLGWKLKEDGDWLTVQPADAYRAWYERTPRKELDEYLASYIKHNRATFDDYSAFLAKLRWPSEIDRSLARILGLPINRLNSGATNWHLLRLYGRMAPSQQLQLAQGASLRYTALSSDQREPYLGAALSRSIRSSHKEMISGREEYVSYGDQKEPTEVFVDGLPRGASLSIIMKRMPAVFAYQRIGEELVPYVAMQPRTVASYLERQRDPSQRYPGETVMDAWGVGEQREYEFLLQFTEDRWHRFRITEDVPDLDAKPGPWEKLPPEVVEQIRKYLGG